MVLLACKEAARPRHTASSSSIKAKRATQATAFHAVSSPLSSPTPGWLAGWLASPRPYSQLITVFHLGKLSFPNAARASPLRNLATCAAFAAGRHLQYGTYVRAAPSISSPASPCRPRTSARSAPLRSLGAILVHCRMDLFWNREGFVYLCCIRTYSFKP